MTAAHDERASQMPTRDELIREAATAAAQRVDAESVGLDSITIITILTTVLPELIACFRRNDEPDPQEVFLTVRAQCSTPRGRRALHNRTTVRIRRQQKSKGEKISKEAAEQLAAAVIEEALTQNAERVSAVCSVVSDAEFGS